MLPELRGQCEHAINELSEEVINREFSHLKGDTYLDHTGSALYTQTQIAATTNDFKSNFYGNPHSGGLGSKCSTDTVDQVRYRILRHFNTNIDDYTVIFTSGATAALKLVAETFSFDEEGSIGEFAYVQDNHTSVLGMREIVSNHRAEVRCISHNEAFQYFVGNFDTVPGEHKGNSLFVYSAQCNFSGIKYPLSWIKKCQKGLLNRNGKRQRWFCLLDAATYVSTSSLDLTAVKPDFVTISFYKMFGFPTGLGALLVRNTSSHLLQKSYYGGGTVLIALSSEMFHKKRPELHERFEDGTINFLSIVALWHGFKSYENLYGRDMQVISRHCHGIAQYLHNRLLKLHHSNNAPAIKLYHDTDYKDSIFQGNIVNFNVLRSNGNYVGFAEVQDLANLHGVHLRTGCFCNPGACQRHLNHSTELLRHHFQEGHVCGDSKDLIDGLPTGSVRVSFGPYSRLKDADHLVEMIENCFILKPAVYKIPEDWEEVSYQLMRKFVGENSQNGVSVPEITEQLRNKTDLNKSNIRNGIQTAIECSLRAVNLYPVKSCGSLVVTTRWELDARGLKYDRQWMIVTGTGVALTQKNETKLCLIKPCLNFDTGELILYAKGHGTCLVPLDIDHSESTMSVAFCQSKVCGDCISGNDCGDEVALWLSAVLDRTGVRLIRQSEHDNRSLKNPNATGDGKQSLLSLSNQSQFLLVNKSSIDWLSDQLPQDSTCSKASMVDRFRANFILEGPKLEPFIEQTWKKVRIGNVWFMVTGPCRRCQMICIDQSSGVRTKEPLTTLTASLQGKLQFGIYLTQIDENGQNAVHLGDRVECFS